MAYPIEDEVLIKVYDEQELTPEKLAGSAELIRLARRYHEEAKRESLIHENTLLQALLDLRKAGKLPRKTDRAIKKVKPEGWPPYKELKVAEGNGEKFYEVKLTHRITLRSIVAAIYAHMQAYGNPRPLTRAEAYQIVSDYAPLGFVDGDGLYGKIDDNGDDFETYVAIAKQLFPELIQS